MIYYNFSIVLDLHIANPLDVDNVPDLFYITNSVSDKFSNVYLSDRARMVTVQIRIS